MRIDPLERFVGRIFEGQGLTNSFRELRKPIPIPAFDLDRAERKVFGDSPDVDPPISLAVTASSAIPRLYGPVQVGASFFVDGAVGGAANLDIALDRAWLAYIIMPSLTSSHFPSCWTSTFSARMEPLWTEPMARMVFPT